MSIFAHSHKKTVIIEGVKFVLNKLSLEKQLTIGSLYNAQRSDEAVLSLIQSCVESWDAKDDAGKDVPLNPENIKAMSVDVANKLNDEIMSFNSLNKDQVKN